MHRLTWWLIWRQIALMVLLAGLVPASLSPAMAQDLPQWQSTTVNDLAGLLTPEDAGTIDQALSALRDETGIEGTVVTLPDRARYGGEDGLAPFATRLFNHWGVGDAKRNDGFMILVLAEDRETRIELGRGYANDADILAQDIIRNTMLPAFRDGQLSQGIRESTQDVIKLIAQPTAQDLPLERRGGWLRAALPFVMFGGLLALMGRQIWRRNRCPKCGKRDLTTAHQPHHVPQPAGGTMVTQNDVTRSCPHCGWSETRQRPTREVVWFGPDGTRLRSERNPAYRAASDGRSSGFGGGSSRGGASGRW